MDCSFDLQTEGFSLFDSFMPDDTGLNWESYGTVWDSLVLESDVGALLDAPAANNTSGKNNGLETKNVAALKSHCEAERRRRERINCHLASLRNFVPCHDKMDKATLLAEVIRQVKVLKKQALEVTNGLVVPTDADEVTVELYSATPNDAITFKASVCSGYKPELIPDLRQAISGLKLTVSTAEISTLGSRVKTVFIVTGRKQEIGHGRTEKIAKSIRKALTSVLDKITASEEYAPRTLLPNKKRRVSYSESLTLNPSLV